MKVRLGIFMAALVAAFVLCAPVYAAFDAGAYGYPANVVAKLRAACYGPEVIGVQRAWPETRPIGYRWQEPHIGWQTYVYQLAEDTRYTTATVVSLKAKYATKTLGAWLTATNQSLTRNPWKNASALAAYWKASIDRAAYRATLITQYGAGWEMSDPAVVAAVNKRADDTIKLAFGSGSGVLWDENGIMVPNAYGYASNQPDLPSWWVKPANCTAAEPTPTPVQIVGTPTPVPTFSTGLKCRNPETGDCFPPIFGNACPSGWTPCGQVPTPTPTITPTATTPETNSTVACLSADGRYSYAATSCQRDEIPLVRKP